MIRRITKEDYSEINKLWNEFHEGARKEIDLSGEEFVCKPVSLCVEENGGIVGFVSGFVYGFNDEYIAYLEDLFVKEEFRKKGYGRELVEAFEKEVKQMGNVYVFVLLDFEDEEESPIPFYERLGYSKLKRPALVKDLNK